MKRSLEKESALETLINEAPAAKIFKQVKKNYTRILVDGYYGNHSDMTAQALELMCQKAISIVQDVWQIPWQEVIWISTTGTWMKAIPLILMQWGFGHAIEFYLPCHWKLTEKGFDFMGTEGYVLTTSMTHMQKRLAESKKVNLCEVPHMKKQLQNCVTDTKASMFYCDGFNQQRADTFKAATHMIHFPHFAPSIGSNITVDKGQSKQEGPEVGSKEYNDAFYRQGGKSYDSMPTKNRYQVNVYDELRKNGLGGITVPI